MDLSKVPNIEFSASLLSVAYDCLTPEEFRSVIINVVDKIRDSENFKEPEHLSKGAYRFYSELYDIAVLKARNWYNRQKNFIENNPKKKKD